MKHLTDLDFSGSEVFASGFNSSSVTSARRSQRGRLHL
jgi:hypothetical protein